MLKPLEVQRRWKHTYHLRAGKNFLKDPPKSIKPLKEETGKYDHIKVEKF